MEAEGDGRGMGTVPPSQELLLQHLRSNENQVFEELTKEALRKKSIDVNFVYPHPVNKSLLDIACSEGQEDFVVQLLELGANPNKVNEVHKLGPIHFAAEAGNSRILEILLRSKNNVNPDLQAPGQQTALHIAAKSGHADCARVLLSVGGADPNIRNCKGVTPIHIAANLGHRKVVQLFLENTRIPVDIDGYRDFRNATTRDILLKKMPDLQLPPKRSSIAANDNSESEECQFLDTLKKISSDDVQALEESMENAVRRNYPGAIPEIMKKVDSRTAGFGKSAARAAVELGNYDVLREILAADPKLANQLLLPTCQELGAPTLSVLRQGPNAEDVRTRCLRLIMEQPNVNVRCQDNKGNTPLHYAARAESREAVDLLLRSGSYLGHKNLFGSPPLAHMSPESLSEFFDSCLRSENDHTDEFEIEFDYRCLMPHAVSSSFVLDDEDGEDTEGLRASGTMKKSRNPNEKSDRSNPNVTSSEMETLVFIAKNPALKPLLKHPLLSSFLYLKWHRIRHILYINFVFYVVFYMLINAYVLSTNYRSSKEDSESMNSSTSRILPSRWGEFQALTTFATIALVILALREIMQFLSSPRYYMTNFENILEVLLVFLAGWSLVAPNPPMGAVVILLSAWELVILIGQHPRMSTGIQMFKTVSLNFARFLFLYAFLILAFALAFFTLFKDSADENFPDPGHSLFKTIIMLTGEFEAASIPFISHPVTSHFIFILFVFFIAIVLFNLLNGLAVSDTAEILNKSELVALTSRTRLVAYTESIALASGLVKLTKTLSSPFTSATPAPFFNPIGIFARRVLLFVNYLPHGKIAVKPYKYNQIRVYGKGRKSPHCFDLTMDPAIVRSARQIISGRGRVSDHERTIDDLDSIKNQLKNLVASIENLRLGLANNNQHSTD